jgi:ribosomal-protein-alanine N-acetyltransferase
MLSERLETARLDPRPIAAGDVLVIAGGYAPDPEIARYLTWRPHRRLAESETYIDTGPAAAPGDEPIHIRVSRTEGRPLGAFALRRSAASRIDPGHVPARPFAGRGPIIIRSRQGPSR